MVICLPAAIAFIREHKLNEFIQGDLADIGIIVCGGLTSGVLRECGWGFAPGFQGATCVPGELVTIGCGCSIPGSCGGDPMLRVCEGTEACGSATSLAFVDDTCGLCPQVEFQCPETGVYSVLSGPFSSGQPFVCELKSAI